MIFIQKSEFMNSNKKKLIKTWDIKDAYIKHRTVNSHMRFISGLKSLSKKALLLVIVIIFIISWLLFIIGFVVLQDNTLSRYIFAFLSVFAGFTFVLLIISLFVPIEKIGIIIIIITALLTVPVVIIFGWIIDIFYLFCFFANAAITAFFAYKVCMDTSTKVDNVLYEKKGSRIFTRSVEFIGFLLLSWWLISLLIRFFRGYPAPGAENFARVFVNLFWVFIFLIIIVLLRLVLTKKLAAYITLFNLLIFFYVIYLVIDLWTEFIFFDNAGYDILSFLIDLLLFIYIIGSLFDRVDYLKEKLKIFRAGTIALFVILMKLIVQLSNIRIELEILLTPLEKAALIIYQVQVLWWFFIFFTIVIGMYTIFRHKEGQKS